MDQAPVSPLPKDTHLSGIIIIIIITSLDPTMQYLIILSGWLVGSEMEMMMERFAKLLLGEDMSGGGKGVSSALALSNAITNLAGIFIYFKA